MKQTGKKTPKKPIFCLTVLFVLTLASCASTGSSQEQKLEDLLKNSVDTFNSAFKWEDYSEAAAFVPPGNKEQFWAEADKFKSKIRISDYEVRQVDSKGKGGLATAILHLQYWRPEAPVLQSVTFTQKWYYTEKDKLWRVSDTGFQAITGGRAGF